MPSRANSLIVQDLSDPKPLINKQFSRFSTPEGSFDPDGPWSHVYQDISSHLWETRNLIDDPQYKPVVAEHEAMLADFESSLIPGTEFTRK